MKCYKGNLFVVPVSYLIENIEGLEKENFENGVFQYEGMVCGMVEEINFERKWFLAPFKAPDWNQVLTLEILPDLYVVQAADCDMYLYTLPYRRSRAVPGWP